MSLFLIEISGLKNLPTEHFWCTLSHVTSYFPLFHCSHAGALCSTLQHAFADLSASEPKETNMFDFKEGTEALGERPGPRTRDPIPGQALLPGEDCDQLLCAAAQLGLSPPFPPRSHRSCC